MLASRRNREEQEGRSDGGRWPDHLSAPDDASIADHSVRDPGACTNTIIRCDAAPGADAYCIRACGWPGIGEVQGRNAQLLGEPPRYVLAPRWRVSLVLTS